MANITLKDWYQLDYSLPNASEAKTVLLKIKEVVSQLKSLGLANAWFFLFEGDTIRVRLESSDKNELQKKLVELSSNNKLVQSDNLPFSDYQESEEQLFNETFVEGFAKIMVEVTKLTIAKLKNDVEFDNYRALERLQHCMFNNLLTLSFKKEEYFLLQRLMERTRKPSDKDFENKI